MIKNTKRYFNFEKFHSKFHFFFFCFIPFRPWKPFSWKKIIKICQFPNLLYFSFSLRLSASPVPLSSVTIGKYAISPIPVSPASIPQPLISQYRSSITSLELSRWTTIAGWFSCHLQEWSWESSKPRRKTSESMELKIWVLILSWTSQAVQIFSNEGVRAFYESFLEVEFDALNGTIIKFKVYYWKSSVSCTAALSKAIISGNEYGFRTVSAS